MRSYKSDFDNAYPSRTRRAITSCPATKILKLSDLDRWWRRSTSKFSATLFGIHEFSSLSSLSSYSDIHFLIFLISSGTRMAKQSASLGPIYLFCCYILDFFWLFVFYIPGSSIEFDLILELSASIFVISS